MMPLTRTSTSSATTTPTPTWTATSMAAQSSIHLHFYSRRLTVSACHLALCAAAYAKSSGIECPDPIYEYEPTPAGNAPCRVGGSGTFISYLASCTFAKLLQCRKFLSHVYKKFNACKFHILCSQHPSIIQWANAMHFCTKKVLKATYSLIW